MDLSEVLSMMQVIKDQAFKTGCELSLALAVASVETSFRPKVVRYEPNWTYWHMPYTYSAALQISFETEKRLQMFSWGVMQVMGSVCRELGYKDHLTALIDPSLGALYGCMKLKSLSHSYSNLEDLISAYNAGTPTPNNKAYVQEVLKRRSTF